MTNVALQRRIQPNNKNVLSGRAVDARRQKKLVAEEWLTLAGREPPAVFLDRDFHDASTQSPTPTRASSTLGYGECTPDEYPSTVTVTDVVATTSAVLFTTCDSAHSSTIIRHLLERRERRALLPYVCLVNFVRQDHQLLVDTNLNLFLCKRRYRRRGSKRKAYHEW